MSLTRFKTLSIFDGIATGLFMFQIPSQPANSQTVNAVPTATTLTAVNTKTFTGTAGHIVLPAITPAANGGGITLTGLNFAQGAIANVADSEAITVKHIVMSFAAGAALETGVLTQTAIDITLANQAANGANNAATGIKITGGALAGGASAYQRGIDITMAAATDAAINIGAGVLSTLGAVTIAAAAATDGQTNDAPLFTLRNYYDADAGAGVTSTAWDLSLLHDMTAAGAAPASSGIFKINSVAVLTLTNTNGTPSATFPGNVTMRGSEFLVKAPSGSDATILLYPDNEEDNADHYRIVAKDSGNLQIDSFATGAWVNIFDLTNAGTLGVAVAYKVGANQVVGARQVDARIDDTPNSGDATTDGIIAALQACVRTHGLMTEA